MDAHSYVRRVREVYPALSVQSARLNPRPEGEYNDLLIVNEALVFRFPRYPEGARRLVGVARLLRAIHGRLPLPTPDPQYLCAEPPEVGLAFLGYPLLPGRPLTRDALAASGDETVLQRCADQLAGFLRALHTLPAQVLEAAVPGELAQFQPLAPWEHLHARIRQRLYPYMRPDARRSVDERFDAFLSNPAHATIVPALIHGDFGTGNWLHDPGRGELTGVVDFDHAGLGDPAVDVAAASTAATASPQFVSRFRRSYGVTRDMAARARFYAATFVLQEALFGADHGDAAAFAALSAYQEPATTVEQQRQQHHGPE